jgi:RNA polymerase sigma factor (sigma-70 family)
MPTTSPTEPESADLLRILSSWHARAQSAAQRHATHATKRAVRQTEMSEAEQAAAHALYREHKGLIRRICSAALSKARQSPEQPPLSLPDLMQEAYVLFLRALVRYDPAKGSMDTYLKHALRSRITDYLRSRSERVAAPGRDSSGPAPEPDRSGHQSVDMGSVAEELLEEYDLPERARHMWQRLCGPDGPAPEQARPRGV